MAITCLICNKKMKSTTKGVKYYNWRNRTDAPAEYAPVGKSCQRNLKPELLLTWPQLVDMGYIYYGGEIVSELPPEQIPLFNVPKPMELIQCHK